MQLLPMLVTYVIGLKEGFIFLSRPAAQWGVMQREVG